MAVMWLEYVTDTPIAEKVALAGIPERMGHSFSDTANPYIMAAYRLGIIDGTVAPTDSAPGTFNPNGLLNRQQAAVIIMNVTRLISDPVDIALVSDFADMDLAAAWAHPGINFVYATGIMSGVGNNRFNPLGYYTREMGIVTFDNIDCTGLMLR